MDNPTNFFEAIEKCSSWIIEEKTQTEHSFYLDLVNSINDRNLQKFIEIANNCGEFKCWINKFVYTKPPKTNGKGDGDGKHNHHDKNLKLRIVNSIGIHHNHNYKAMTLCHLAAINNAREIMKFLIANGGDLSKQVLDISETSTHRKITLKDSVLDLIIIYFREPIAFLKVLLNDSISCEDNGNDFEFILDFSILCPNTNENWTQDYIEEVPIRQMTVLNAVLNSTDDIHSEQYDLLNHPLIESFLTCKWKHYRRFFFTLVALHLLFVCSISSAIILVVKNFQQFHNETISILVTKNFTTLIDAGDDGDVNFKNANVDNDDNANYNDGNELERLIEISDHFHLTIQLINIFQLFAVVFSIFLFVHGIIQASFIPLKKLFWELEICLNLVTAPCAIIICIYMITMPVEGYFDMEHRWIYHVSSLLILPAWINLMLIVGRFPKLGCYSLMFTTVLQNFLKVMISFIFLIVGFALSFSLVFPKSEFFRDPGQATLRTIVMMVGEFDYMNTFSEEENYFIIGTSRLIFLLFIISCSIILMNLTQGIAVNDIKLLHEISQVIRLEKETRFLYELESVFSHPYMTSHPFFRKIKRELYDHGTEIVPIKVKRDNKQGISNSIYDTLVREYRHTN